MRCEHGWNTRRKLRCIDDVDWGRSIVITLMKFQAEIVTQTMARLYNVVLLGMFVTIGAVATSLGRVLLNAAIETLDPAEPRAKALAVCGDRIAAPGISSEINAIRDRVTREATDLYAKLSGGHANMQDRCWRTEHAQHLRTDDVPLLARLGVVASMHGVSATTDRPWMAKRFGDERAGGGTFVWRSQWDVGAVVTNGNSFYPEESLTRVETLASFNINSARAALEEALKGHRVPRTFADFVMLSHDSHSLSMPVSKLLWTRVMLCVIGGRIVYSGHATRTEVSVLGIGLPARVLEYR